MVNHLDDMLYNQRSFSKEENDPELVEGPASLSWFVYICVSRHGYYYVGISPDPQNRLLAHNSGNGSKMAKDHSSFKLVYISQPYANQSIARKREIQVKKWKREKKEKLISGEGK